MVENGGGSPFIAFVLAIILSISLMIVVGALAGWLASVRVQPFRYWAEHPWQIFWAGLFVATAGSYFYVALNRTIGLLLFVTASIISTLSATHGLRLTWHRSHRKAVLIAECVWVLFLAQAVSKAYHARDVPELIGDLGGGILSVPCWILTVFIAERMARRTVT
jgi:uncharacterized membrane-anchored protein